MKTGIVILAAGNSSRMNGGPKQLLKFRGKSLLRGAVEASLRSHCRPVVVVLGANAEQLIPEIAKLNVFIEINEDWKMGISSSIRVGLNRSTKVAVLDAVIFTLCDQPLVNPTTFDNLCQAHQRSGSPIIAGEYENTIGVPALFTRPLFDDLLSLSGDKGAKLIITKKLASVERIPMPEAALDIDSKEDYARLAGLA